MIRVTVRLLGPAADLVGTDQLEYQLTPPAMLATLVELLFVKHPPLAARRQYLRFAINNDYAPLAQPLNDGDEVGVIPPVSGGSDDHVLLTHDKISACALLHLIQDACCGGIVTFEGVVRSEDAGGKTLEALEYSAYDAMAVGLMRGLRNDARIRYAIRDAAIAHRLGRLAVGECSVAIAVSAGHRGAAFDACRWIIDTLKRDVPIWKKEIWSSGPDTWADASAVHP